MVNCEVAWAATSTNGRWGIAIVCMEPALSRLEKRSDGYVKFPVRGTIHAVDKIDGISTYELVPDDNADTWVLANSLWMEPKSGASTVINTSLQSGKEATILLLTDMAVVTKYDYRARGSDTVAYINGEEKNIPAPVLLAMGLVRPSGNSKIAPIPNPEPMEDKNKQVLQEYLDAA